MNKLILSLALVVGMVLSTTAQNVKGDWYVGTGDVANVAWTDLSIAPTLGYAVSNKVMVGLAVAQADSSQDLAIDIHARYFMTVAGQDIFLYAAMPEFDYHSGEKTTNMMLGFGMKF